MKTLVNIICLFCVLFCYTQNRQIDSVSNVLKYTSEDNNKTFLYIQLSKLYKTIDIDSAIYYAELGNKLAETLNFNLGKAETAANLGDCYVIQNNLDEAKLQYINARLLFKETDSLFKYTQNTMRLGNINLAQNNHIEALKLYQECLNISKDNNYKTLLPHLYNNTGLLYKQIEDYDDAQSNFQNAYQLFLENGDEANSVYPLYNISIIQSTIGNDEEAINGYLNLVSYHLKTENWVSLASVYNSISEIYIKNEDYQRAQEYVEMALNAIEDKSDSFNSGPSSFYEASIYTNAAQLYFNEGNNELAKTYANKAIKLSKDNSYRLNLTKSAKILGDLYNNVKQTDSSLKYYKLYIEESKEYQTEYDVKQITKLKMQNEFDDILRKNEIERIYKEASYKNRELKFIGLTVFAGLLAIILILLYINQKNKNAKLKLKEENLELEKKKLNQDLQYKNK